MSDEERKFKVIATKEITAEFEVYADDEEDAEFQINNTHMSYEVTVSDSMRLDQSEWNVTDVEETT